jgi:hypothetical protein
MLLAVTKGVFASAAKDAPSRAQQKIRLRERSEAIYSLRSNWGMDCL